MLKSGGFAPLVLQLLPVLDLGRPRVDRWYTTRTVGDAREATRPGWDCGKSPASASCRMERFGYEKLESGMSDI